ncbi:MAG: hypothetical protein AABX48_00270 [Nanoarchaeota archaeon]
MKRVILKSNNAIGDTVCISSLIKPLRDLGFEPSILAKPFIFPLFEGMNLELLDNNLINLKENEFLDISRYWDFNPNSNPMPSEFSGKEKPEIAHLSEWMGYALNYYYGLSVHSSKEDVKVLLTKNEVIKARNLLKSISTDKPIVALPLFATTKNRNLLKKTIEDLVSEISAFAIPLFLPTANIKNIPNAVYLSDNLPLRETAAILYASDQIVGVDTGPTHLANAVLQGTPDYEIKGVNPSKGKVLLILGSTHPSVIAYSSNRVLSRRKYKCPLAEPCGAVGYSCLEDAQKRFSIPFYKSGREGDASGCIFNDYTQSDVSKCMQEISAQEVIANIRAHIKDIN